MNALSLPVLFRYAPTSDANATVDVAARDDGDDAAVAGRGQPF
jgi:hypothetical protein